MNDRNLGTDMALFQDADIHVLYADPKTFRNHK